MNFRSGWKFGLISGPVLVYSSFRCCSRFFWLKYFFFVSAKSFRYWEKYLLQPLDFQFVFLNVRLVHRQFLVHCLDLGILVLDVLLVDWNHLLLLSGRLSLHHVPQLQQVLLLVLDQLLLVDDLLRLFNQSALETLDFSHKFKGFRVGSLKFTPPVHIHWVFKFLSQSLDLQLLLNPLLRQVVDLRLQVRNGVGLLLVEFDFSNEICNFIFQQLDVSQSFPVLLLALVESRLIYFYFFVEELGFRIPPYKLGA